MLSPPLMIYDIDVMVNETGRITLLIPGKIPSGALAVRLETGRVRLSADGADFVSVDHVEETVLDAMASQAGGMGLIEILDPENPPVTETHRAEIVDSRPA